jgi:hypothetical protein
LGGQQLDRRKSRWSLLVFPFDFDLDASAAAHLNVDTIVVAWIGLAFHFHAVPAYVHIDGWRIGSPIFNYRFLFNNGAWTAADRYGSKQGSTTSISKTDFHGISLL